MFRSNERKQLDELMFNYGKLTALSMMGAADASGLPFFEDRIRRAAVAVRSAQGQREVDKAVKRQRVFTQGFFADFRHTGVEEAFLKRLAELCSG